MVDNVFYKLATEIFFLEKDISHETVYFPNLGYALQVEEHVAQTLRDIKNGKFQYKNDNIKLLNTLQSLGIIKTSESKLDHASADRSVKSFSPIRVTLVPTYQCNLRCVYCYSNGGANPLRMSIDYAKAAIDLVITNAVSNSHKSIELSFHGGGEPFQHWQLIISSVDYARKQANKNNLQATISATSNCVLSNTQRKWITENFDSINVSLDGTQQIQDTQRPMVSGEGSYSYVANTLRYFDDMQFPYSIRATITNSSVFRMAEIVRHFCMHFDCRSLHFEPLFECGRCITSGEKAPNAKVFAQEFIKARKIAHKLEVNLNYSGSRLNLLTKQFCGLGKSNFFVLPDGIVTSCLEVCRKEDPRSQIFFYGKYCEKTQEYRFDESKLEFLKSRIVDSISDCQDCFLKYHCAGDCPAKAISISGTIFSPAGDRCQINKEIALNQIKTQLIT